MLILGLIGGVVLGAGIVAFAFAWWLEKNMRWPGW